MKTASAASAVLCAVLLSACGPADLTGSWHGQLATIVACSDHSGGTTQADATWSIARDPSMNGALTVTPLDGSCGSFIADSAGCVAVLREKTCTSSSNLTSRLVDGTLSETNGGLLEVSMHLNVTTSAGICDATTRGALQP